MPDMFQAFIAQIRRIPRGKVASYGDIAYAAGYPGAARQVAWALHSSRGLPWHRVIGAEGKILCTGELGFEQRMRLQQEGVRFVGLRVAIDEHRFNFFGKGDSLAKKRQRKKAKSKKRLSSPRRRS
jgi:methylated-DNA-protein-cysteine methyltransferase-like protein